MAPILDLAVVVLAVMVCVSLGLLAWTLGVSVTRALRRTRENLVNTRLELTVAERRLRDAARALAAAREAGNAPTAEARAAERRAEPSGRSD